MSEGGPPQRAPLEALLLAFRHSAASRLAGDDALRAVLTGQYRELVHGGTFHLAPVWDLLASQDEFEPEAVKTALARFKSWQPRLGLEILLPPAMAALTESQLGDLAARVHVPTAELAQIWRPGRGGDPSALTPTPTPTPRPVAGKPPAAVRIATGKHPATARAATGKRPSLLRRWSASLTARQRTTVMVGAVLIAVAGFAVAGYTLYSRTRTRSWDEVSIGFAGDIPIARAERSGTEVGATLSNDRWLSLPRATRSSQLRAALERLPDDVLVLFLRDRHGAIRATARWYGTSRAIDVVFR
jgi:hypothetical protein